MTPLSSQPAYRRAYERKYREQRRAFVREQGIVEVGRTGLAPLSPWGASGTYRVTVKDGRITLDPVS